MIFVLFLTSYFPITITILQIVYFTWNIHIEREENKNAIRVFIQIDSHTIPRVQSAVLIGCSILSDLGYHFHLGRIPCETNPLPLRKTSNTEN